MAVLVNGGSASASEIVAAALQDNGRAVVVGSNSYGKGTVQTVFTMPNKGELTVTWARFHAPSGYTLNHLGVLPNICTDDESLDATQIMAELGAGRIPPLPVAERNSVSPEDTQALDRLRAQMPRLQGGASHRPSGRATPSHPAQSLRQGRGARRARRRLAGVAVGPQSDHDPTLIRRRPFR